MMSQAAPAASQGDLLSIAAVRHDLLAMLIEDSPAEVLRVAIPGAIRASLPSAVQPYIEQEVELEGELEVLYEDREESSRLLYLLQSGRERHSLHFATHQPNRFQTGARVRVAGVQVGTALAVASVDSGVTALAAALPNTTGEQRVLVILVNFQDKPTEQPYTPEYAGNVVFGTVSDFFRENSQQQTWLTGDVYGWYTIALDSTSCNTSQIASLAKQAAAAAGADLSAYNRYLYAFPANACGWSGYSTVGGNPSQGWIRGTFALRIVGHELGHSLGLYHANLWECGTTTLGSSCSAVEYGDTIDIMGGGTEGHCNTFQKERLGWLPDEIATVQSSGTYVLAPYEAPGSANPKALKILKETNPSTGKQTWYYVEYRQPIGFDSFLSTNNNVRNGVLIHSGSESSGNSSNLLDMTPTDSDWYNPALVVGQNFSDPDVGVTITPLWANSTGVAVDVSFIAQACRHAAPTVVVAPAQSQWAEAGAAVTYTVSVTNNDGTGCTASDFTLQPAAPSGWTATFSSSTLTINPGSSASTMLTVTSPPSAADGFYTIGVEALHSAEAVPEGLTVAAYVVASGLNVAVAPAQPNYPQRARVSVTANVSFAGSFIKGAKVTFTITKPNGARLQKTVTTKVDGSASFTFRLRKTDPSGTYYVIAKATWQNMSPGEATMSFIVQ
jgi:hypothetical protein